MPLFSQHIPSSSRPGTPAHGSTGAILLKRYRPLETRATGGFGSVEICLDARLQRRVAIKRMPLATPTSTQPAETRETALAEARTASMLQHPNIVSVIDFTYDDAYAYLVMEYVDGMSLEEFLAQVDGHSLTYDEAACIGDALVQALSFAHENGVLHLDIKPANVLIDRNGHVKLTDFGMATLSMAAGYGDARGGTVGYMPPEQIIGAAVDERTDIFSLGAVLYESLCGTAPFRAGTPADSIKRIDKGVIQPSLLLPDMPELSELALEAALAPHPDDRPTSVDEFGDRFLERLGSPRAGRASLARIIAELTADDLAEDADGATGHGHVWELDPAEGYLGSRCAQARRIAVGVLGGASVAVGAYALLETMGLSGVLGGVIAALAIGAAAGVAPQLGSALIATGFMMMILTSTDFLSVLAIASLFLAGMAGWWYAWGRTNPAASALMAACAAAGVLTGDTILLAGPIAAIAGYFLSPVCAVASMAAGLIFSRLLETAIGAGGELGSLAALSTVGSPRFVAGAAGAILTAIAASMLLRRLWRNVLDARGTKLLPVCCLVPGIMVVLLLCLANPMEIASVSSPTPAIALGVGALSSILLCICVKLLGYRKELAEADRS